jgi:asparagine synthase (glutamine-hydrolysing)
MCGIAGGISLRADRTLDIDRVRRLSALVGHRGPDGHGLWIAPSGRAALAHRRLAIIDLASGAQPMVDNTGRVAVTFNGEIYNYVELREGLRANGRSFATESDTEVLLAAFLVKGVRCLDEMRGMFAFAAWDDAAGRLTLARDRLGKKPLFYVREGNCLYFASSLDALRKTSTAEWHVNRAALETYLALGYVPAPATIYDEVSKLESGTVFVVDPGGQPDIERYWHPADASRSFEGTFEQAVDRTHELLIEAVRLRLRSDVPLGVFLSGGVDSSLLTAVAQRECGVQLQTFSVGFDAAGHDETESATFVARHLGTTHRNFHARPELLEFLPEILPQFGEPFADPAVLPLWVLARETRKHVTVALGGDGGDEGFGGYAWYRTARRLRAARQLAGGSPLAPARSRLSAMLVKTFPHAPMTHRVRRAVEAMTHDDPALEYARLRTLFTPRERQALRPGRTEVVLDRTADLFRAAGGDPLRRMRYADIGTYLADCLNPKVDVATMAHALEARAPLLDHTLIEFGLGLPTSYLIDARGGKRVLRTLLARYFPSEIINRPKHGFTVPLDEWFRGTSRFVADRLARSEALAALGCLDMSAVASLVGDHVGGRRDHGDRLFALLALDTWARAQ